MTIKDFLNSIENIQIEIPIYTIVTEISDEPCSAEVRAFTTLESAMKALQKQFKNIIETYELPADKIAFAKENFEENSYKAFVVTLDEDDCVQYYARIETLTLEN